MANFLDKIFGSKVEVDLVKMELESKLSFHESRLDNYLAKQIAERNNPELNSLFSSYLSAAASLTEDSQISMRNELDLLEKYIQMYKHIQKDQLFLRFDLVCEADDKQLPAFTLFPLVSNALQHGYNSMDKFPLKIKIRVYEKAIQLEVSNRVNHHIESQEHNKLIDYYKNRLSCLFPDQHTLLFNSNSQLFKANLHIQLS